MMQYALGAALGAATIGPRPASAADKTLCDEACIAALDKAQAVTTASGLKYKDIVVGSGPSPPVGYQVVVNYIAMTPEGRVFDSSLDRGTPYDIRIGAGTVVVSVTVHMYMLITSTGHPGAGRGLADDEGGRRAAALHPRGAGLPQGPACRGWAPTRAAVVAGHV